MVGHSRFIVALLQVMAKLLFESFLRSGSFTRENAVYFIGVPYEKGCKGAVGIIVCCQMAFQEFAIGFAFVASLQPYYCLAHAY